MNLKYKVPQIPRLVPKPSFVRGVANPVLPLDGLWKVKHADDLEKARTDENWTEWTEIPVPADMRAYRNRVERWTGLFVFKKLVALPDEMQNMDLVLRFEGVNGFAKVYIDDDFVAEHKNGFVTWNINITGFVGGKKEFALTVEVDNNSDKVCYHNRGGIIRSSMIYALPKSHITMLHTTTTMEGSLDLWNLKVHFDTAGHGNDIGYKFELVDTGGRVVQDNIPIVKLPAGTDAGLAEIHVEKPLLWDAEHPNLYFVRASVYERDELLQQVMHRFGFRQITRVGNRLFVNGDEVKLRGSCRHEVSPLNARALTRELIEKDVELFKEANCNYIRTSHYPPSEYFLELCDEKGIYVEDELDMAFIARTLDYTQRDPEHTERYLSVFAELLARDYSHPCVLIWSLCNESFGGYNFDIMNRFAHRMDPTRPTKFSYPMTMREEHEPVDIWSIHYSNLEEDLSKKCDNVSVGYSPGKDVPVIHDEYVHVPCYNRTEHRRDPNVRNFWGESIKRFWDKIWNTEGALGGAIWAGIDETDVFVGGSVSLEWGIIDIWRRKKPEHYLTRKAYSPLVLRPETTAVNDGMLSFEVENRFCHTNLSEVTMTWSWGRHNGKKACPDAKPRDCTRVYIEIPRDAGLNEPVNISFIDPTGFQVDEYRIVPGDYLDTEEKNMPEMQHDSDTGVASINYAEDGNEFSLSGGFFTLTFDKKTGLLKNGSIDGETVLIGGPFLNTPYLKLGKWMKATFDIISREPSICVIRISGSYGAQMDVTFVITVSADGTMHTRYAVDKLKVPLPKQIKLRVGVDCGGLDEIGVYYIADPSMDTLKWKRKGLWTVYPDDHIGRCEGIAKKRSSGSELGKEPGIPWCEEMKSYILNGKYDVDYRGTNDFRSLKENIITAALYKAGGAGVIEAVSDGSHSVRMEVQEPDNRIIACDDPRIVYKGNWYRMEDYSGSLNGIEMWTKEAGAYAEFTFEGTGIVWYGPVDVIYGIASVYIDGVLMDDAVNQQVNGVDFPGSAAGYDKKYDYPVYSITGLENKEHTIRIEATGRKSGGSKDSYIVLDHFRVICAENEEPIRFIINNDYNYPHIAWGNYSKPAIMIDTGYCNSVTMRFVAAQNQQ